MRSEQEIYQHALKLVEEKRGKLQVLPKVSIDNLDDLCAAYTPGVAEPCRRIMADHSLQYRYTSKGSFWAVVTDGSAVLGLGNTGPEAAHVVMEGKAALLKVFAQADAVPICLATQNTEEIINVIKAIAPGFGGIFLEDIAAPRCFEIERRLADELPIPVFHDDQHGTAMAVCAGLTNVMRLTGKTWPQLNIVILGAGASAQGTADLLWAAGARNITLCDSRGVIHPGRTDLDTYKQLWAERLINTAARTPQQAIAGADVCIGLSVPGTITPDMVRSMAANAIVFALANPQPEIMPPVAHAAGAKFTATGRFDYANTVNNLLAFPGLVRGLMESGAKKVNTSMKLAAAAAIAAHVPDEQLHEQNLLPNPLDPTLAQNVAKAVSRAAKI